jgi:hypothetical protein
MLVDAGGWRSMAEDGGAWRRMAEHGGAWRSMAEDGLLYTSGRVHTRPGLPPGLAHKQATQAGVCTRAADRALCTLAFRIEFQDTAETAACRGYSCDCSMYETAGHIG